MIDNFFKAKNLSQNFPTICSHYFCPFIWYLQTSESITRSVLLHLMHFNISIVTKKKKKAEIYFYKMKRMQIKRKNDINASQTNIANHITLSIVISFVTVNLFLWPIKFKTSCIKRANKFSNFFYYRLLLVIRIVIS